MFLLAVQADPQGGTCCAVTCEGSTGKLMLNISALMVKQMMSVLLQLPEPCVMGSFQTLSRKKNELSPTTDYKTLLNYFAE